MVGIVILLGGPPKIVSGRNECLTRSGSARYHHPNRATLTLPRRTLRLHYLRRGSIVLELRNLIFTGCFVVLGLAPIQATPLVIKAGPAPDSKSQRAEADAAEKAGKWDRALEFYLKVYLHGDATPELRERIRVCFRNLSQVQRYRDPAFQQFILSLPPAEGLTLYAEALGKIQSLYAQREKATIDKLFGYGLDELERAFADATFRQLNCPDANELKLHNFRLALREGYRVKLPANPREARHVAREIVSAAQLQLGLKNPSAAILELLCGACASLDEFSAFVAPAEVQNDFASPILQLAAYGILIIFDIDGVLIENIVPGSWAANTPMERGQRITIINEKSMAGATPATLRDALKSPLGNFGHEIEVTNAGEELTIDNYRLPTPVPSVYGADMLKDGIGYIRLGNFRESTARELDDAIEALKMRGLRALILDIRGNPGGSLTACLAVAERFLPSGIIVTTQGQSPEFANRVFSSDAGIAASDIPLVLIVDTKTMSAAEIFAGSMKENARATLVGLPTFGKGLIQAPIRLQSLDTTESPNKSGYLLLSVGSAFSPRGNPINNLGVTPHVVQTDHHKQLIEAINKAVEMLNGVPVEMR